MTSQVDKILNNWFGESPEDSEDERNRLRNLYEPLRRIESASIPAVIAITIVCGNGADKVMVYTNAPEPTWPFKDKLCLSFDTAQGTGKVYCAKLWPMIKPTVIEKSKNTY